MPYAQLDDDNYVKVVTDSPIGIPCEWSDAGKVWNGTTFEDHVVVNALTTISPRQFRQALTAIGLRATVEAVIAIADQDTKDWYEYATSFERTNHVLVAMATSLGKTDAEVDAMFALGATL